MLKIVFSNNKTRILNNTEVQELLKIAEYKTLDEFLQEETKYFRCTFEKV